MAGGGLAGLKALAKMSGSMALGGYVAQQCRASDAVDGPGAGLGALLGDLLLPRQAHAYVSVHKAPRLPGATGQPKGGTFYALDRNGQYTKVYPVELRLKTIQSQFEFTQLWLALVRSCVVTFGPLVQAHLNELKRAEREAEERGEEIAWEELPELDWGEARRLLPRLLVNLARDVLVSITRTLLSWWAADRLPRRLVWKLLKDQTVSLRAKRKWPFWQRPYLVARGTLRSLVIPTLADLAVYAALEALRAAADEKLPLSRKASLAARHVAQRLLCNTVNLTASSLAAGAVALVHPGYGCIVASAGAALACDVLVCAPALQDYEHQGRVRRRTRVILLASAGAVAWAFLPWLWPQGEASLSQLEPAPAFTTT